MRVLFGNLGGRRGWVAVVKGIEFHPEGGRGVRDCEGSRCRLLIGGGVCRVLNDGGFGPNHVASTQVMVGKASYVKTPCEG